MAVCVQGVKKRYGRKEILKGIDFSAQSGECIGIVGKNGSGKSTLLSTLAGVIRADEGEFLLVPTDESVSGRLQPTDESVSGRLQPADESASGRLQPTDESASGRLQSPVTGSDNGETAEEFVVTGLAGELNHEINHKINHKINLLKNTVARNSALAYVPQGTPLIEELSAHDNLRMWYEKEMLQAELEDGFLKLLGIDEFLDTPVTKMSGGMKKRLSIGCAINHHPKVLLLDEPTAALDMICREMIYSYFDAFRKEGGIIILATHELREIEMCNQCFLLKDGILAPYEYNSDVHSLIEHL